MENETRVPITNKLGSNPNLDLSDKSKITGIAVVDEANKITTKISELEKQKEEAEKNSFIDKKTGLLNVNALENAVSPK